MKKNCVILSLFFLNSICANVPSNLQELYSNVEVGWPSPTPWLKERFHQFLAVMPKNAVVAEVGVQSGTFAYFIVKNTNPQKLYLIDCWEHQDPAVFDDPEANVEQKQQDALLKEVQKKFAKNPNVLILKRYSKEAAALFEDEYFDWLYIDSNHAYEAAQEDLALWWPKVKRGGYICGHDYIHFKRHGFGVTQALNEFMRDHGLYFTYCTAGDVHESWAIRKP